MSAAWIDDDPVPVEQMFGLDGDADERDGGVVPDDEDDEKTLRRLIDADVDAGAFTFEASTNGSAAALQASTTGEPFVGIQNDDVLKLELEGERFLIEDLVPREAVGTIAGLPETFKSWLAQQIAVAVAAGNGAVLGCEIVRAARVGYWWQDDSTREEVERIKTFHRVQDAPPGLALWWFLNQGLRLPDGIDRLLATVRALQLDLAFLDSFYNVAAGDLKDDTAERIVALLKSEIADATGCSVLIVDHMPWPTDANRQRLRAYGGVFKNAATRFGIYIDAIGKNLSIEARGNNIRGFRRRPAYWDSDALELRLVEKAEHEEKVEERAERLLDLLESEPRAFSKTELRKAVGGRAELADQALELLRDRDRVRDLSRDPGTPPDNQGAGRRWIASIHAASAAPETLSLLDGTAPDGPVPAHTTCPPVPSPVGGQGDVGTGSEVVE